MMIILIIITTTAIVAILISLADSKHNQYDNTYCFEYSIKTPDDRR